VLDRTDLALYGRQVEVAFVDRIRGMVRFGSVEELLEAMSADVARTREILGA
jgi:riboflavin kinase/FMN adenylyltransferase